jgi:hypothetical protein
MFNHSLLIYFFYQVNGEATSLPYNNGNVRIFVHDSNVVVDSSAFNLQYDGIHFIKVRQCSQNVSGICGNNNDNPFDDAINPNRYLVNNYRRGCVRRLP